MQSLRVIRIMKKEKKRLKMAIKPRSKGNGGVPTVIGIPQSGLSHLLSPGSHSDTNLCILATCMLNPNLENEPRNM